jgi:hypothetical protein
MTNKSRSGGYEVSSLEEYVKGLEVLKIEIVPAYYSPGTRERAYELASKADRSYAFLKGFFKADTDLVLLVLNSDDWSKRTTLPYGALFADLGAIHIGAELAGAPAIESLSPMFDKCPEALKKLLISAVGYEKTAFTRAVQIMFDNLLVHEFTHGFAQKRRIRFGAAWLSELFADYTAYAFLKRFEREYKKELCIFEVLPKIFYEGGRPLGKHTSLEDFERLYARVGWLNYVWYHGKFVVGVLELYNRYGESFISNLIDAFEVTDDIIARRINESCKGFEQWFRTWRQEN